MKDELQYWAEVSNNPRDRQEKENARAFYTALEPIGKDFRSSLTYFCIIFMNI